MKIKLFVILSLLAIASLILYEGQKNKVRMNDDAKSTKEEIRMFGDIKSMKAEVLKHVPIGTSIQDAKRIMIENGFSCTMYNNAIVTEKGDEYGNDPEGKKDILHYNADFLGCRKEGTPIQMVYRGWAVIIVHKEEPGSRVFPFMWPLYQSSSNCATLIIRIAGEPSWFRKNHVRVLNTIAEISISPRQLPGHRFTRFPNLTNQIRELPLRFITSQPAGDHSFL